MENRQHISTTSGIRTPMSAEALIATLRRHVPLLREDPNFVEYVINLALYLIEIQEGHTEAKTPVPGGSGHVSTTVMRLRAASQGPASNTCHVCGSPTDGKRVCPHCGHMVG